jgi:hypothetical protein
MPGFLGDQRQFAVRWRKPIEENGETLRAALLAQRVRPFILRRRKQDVATELPPRTEDIILVDLDVRVGLVKRRLVAAPRRREALLAREPRARSLPARRFSKADAAAAADAPAASAAPPAAPQPHTTPKAPQNGANGGAL